MKKLITASLAAAALVAALPTLAAAAPTPPTVGPAVRGIQENRQIVGLSRVVAPKPNPAPATDESGIDRTFHPDYRNALTVQQSNTAWNDEIIRVMEIPQNLGGG